MPVFFHLSKHLLSNESASGKFCALGGSYTKDVLLNLIVSPVF